MNMHPFDAGRDAKQNHGMAGRDIVEARIPIGGRSVSLLLFGALAAALVAVGSALDRRWGTAVIAGVAVAWCVWRISVCGLVVRSDSIELRSIVRSTRLERPCRGRARSSAFGSLVIEPEGRRRIVVRSQNSTGVADPWRFNDARVADVLEACGLDVSALRRRGW
jgi:hypothetical protein